MRTPLFSFIGLPITGSGRGKRLSVPTINLDVTRVPSEMSEGIYACIVELDNNHEKLAASMHFGPRPVFKDSTSCEVHLLDVTLNSQPKSVRVHVIEYLRAVADFPSIDALLDQIATDNAQARAILTDA